MQRNLTSTSVAMTFSIHSSLQQLKKSNNPFSVCLEVLMQLRRNQRQINSKRLIVTHLSSEPPHRQVRPNLRIHSLVIMEVVVVLTLDSLIKLLRTDWPSSVTEKQSQALTSKTMMHITLRCNLASRHWLVRLRSAPTWCSVRVNSSLLPRPNQLLPVWAQASTRNRWLAMRSIWRITQRTFSPTSTANSLKQALILSSEWRKKNYKTILD